MDTRAAIAVVLAIGFVIGGVGFVTAAGDYQLSADGETEIPERALEFDGDEFTVDSIVQVSPGDDITVHSTTPDDEEFNLNLRNTDGDLIDRASDADSTETLSTGSSGPGSYAVILTTDRREAILPVIIAGYDVDIEDAPSEAEPDSTITVEVSVTATASSDEPDAVEVVLGNGGETVREQASKSEDGLYTAQISLDGLSEDTYSIYGVSLIDSDADDVDQEAAGLSSVSELTVESTDDDDDGDDQQSDDGSDDSGGESQPGGDGTGDDDTTPTPTEDPTTNETDTPTPTEEPTTNETDTPTPTEEPTTNETDTPTPTEELTPTPTEEGVITPATETPPGETADDGPGFTALTAGVAVAFVAGLLLARRR